MATTKSTGKKYTVAKGKSISFRAGIKVHGDEVNPEWPEFKASEGLLAAMLKNKSIVEVVEAKVVEEVKHEPEKVEETSEEAVAEEAPAKKAAK